MAAVWSEVARDMKKSFIFFLLALSAFFPFVSACDVHEESEIVGNGIVGFDFFGGMLFTLIAIAIVLGIMIVIRRQEK